MPLLNTALAVRGLAATMSEPLPPEPLRLPIPPELPASPETPDIPIAPIPDKPPETPPPLD